MIPTGYNNRKTCSSERLFNGLRAAHFIRLSECLNTLVQHHPLEQVPPEDFERVCALFRALSDPTRLRLVLALTRCEQSVTDLVSSLEQPQSTVSRHLALLRHSRLVNTRREAARVYYRLEDAHLSAVVIEAFSHAEHERRSLTDHPSSTALSEGAL